MSKIRKEKDSFAKNFCIFEAGSKFLMDNKNSKNINILTWNANSIKNKINELEFVLNQTNIDIVGICETKINKEFKLKARNYKIYRTDRNSLGGGVVLFVNKSSNRKDFI